MSLVPSCNLVGIIRRGGNTTEGSETQRGKDEFEIVCVYCLVLVGFWLLCLVS